ncbi:MAG: hypothetical protein GX646_06555, partial [Bacteroidales bacterium]|nr:hypothetical protein [Bacteroidales bacterium]
RINIEFSPPVPDLVCLRDGLELDGDFVITTDNAAGSVRGVYHVRSRGNAVEIRIYPEKGWIPDEKRLILRLLFSIVKVFKEWPKSYAWNAIINLGSANNPLMKSSWERL